MEAGLKHFAEALRHPNGTLAWAEQLGRPELVGSLCTLSHAETPQYLSHARPHVDGPDVCALAIHLEDEFGIRTGLRELFTSEA